jgi:hypothetical protein
MLGKKNAISNAAKIDWRLAAPDATVKFHPLYPSFVEQGAETF